MKRHIILDDLPPKYRVSALAQLQVKRGKVIDPQQVETKVKPRLRQKRGPKMNKLEEAFLMHLRGMFPASKIYVQSYGLRLANGAVYWPDFVVSTNGLLSVFEVKGPFFRDDSIVKLKVAAYQFPDHPFTLASRPNRGGTWSMEKIFS